MIAAVVFAALLETMPAPWFLPAPLPVVRTWASAAEGTNVPQQTLDDKLDTRWSAEGKGVWIAYELERLANVTEVRIAWFFQPPRRTEFAIELSSDGQEWRVVYVGTGSSNSAQPETFQILGPPAKFVRITGFGSNVSLWTSITEVKILGFPGN